MALIREWVIFALCLGVGGHIALAFVLYAPELWPWRRAGFYGLLSGVAVYALVQVSRLLWRTARKRHLSASSSADA